MRVQRLQKHEVVTTETLEDLAQVIVYIPLCGDDLPQLSPHIDHHDLIIVGPNDVGEHLAARPTPGPRDKASLKRPAQHEGKGRKALKVYKHQNPGGNLAVWCSATPKQSAFQPKQQGRHGYNAHEQPFQKIRNLPESGSRHLPFAVC